MTIHAQLIAAGCSPVQHDRDLYVENTESAREITKDTARSFFYSRLDNKEWIEVPGVAS